MHITLTLALTNQWSLQQIDVNNVVLNDILHEEVYMEPPLGFLPSDFGLLCKLHKSIYGLKQAPRAWYERLTSTLMSFGFVHNKCDSSLLVLNNIAGCIYVLIYIHDIILTDSSHSILQAIIPKLHYVFALKQLGDLDYFLGIEVK